MANNGEYWARRMKVLEDALLDKSYSYVENLERQFSMAEQAVEKELSVWYQRLAENNEVSLAEARRLLNRQELEEFRWTVEEYIAYGQQNALDGAWMKQLENASARVHISRLEAKKLELQQQAEILYANQLDALDAVARETYQEGYYRTAFEVQRGLGVGTVMPAINEKALEKALARAWTADGQTFRDRCWVNKQALVNSVNTQLTQMIIRGEAPDKAIAAISKQFEVSRAKAGRLVMTESAAIASAAQKDCFGELGVEQYAIVASFDKDTCELCGALDGKVFKMPEYEVGLTAPPFHPWCRCCTAPYFEDMRGIGERWSRRADGGIVKVPADMSFGEWKGRFVDGNDLQDTETDGIIENVFRVTFESPELLTRHYEKHRNEFGDITEKEYLERANWLFWASPSKDVEQLTRSDGSVSKYKFSTNEFLVINPDKTIKTYFLPQAKEVYWRYEHERNE